MEMNFRTLSTGTPVPDVIDYIRNYMVGRTDVDILIGCDSQNFGHKKSVYAVVVALYTHGKGGHVLYCREVLPIEKTTSVRLLAEVWKSIEVANFLMEAGLPKPVYIDIDLNNDSKFKSNKVLREAVGMVTGSGYNVRWKHMGAMLTYAADAAVRL